MFKKIQSFTAHLIKAMELGNVTDSFFVRTAFSINQRLNADESSESEQKRGRKWLVSWKLFCFDSDFEEENFLNGIL